MSKNSGLNLLITEGGLCKEKAKHLQSALRNIQKDFGKTSVDVYGAFGDSLYIPRQSTGLVSLDLALGGGFPRGDFIEIYGKPQAGKTTICYWFIGYLQKQGKVVAFIDVEQDFDPVWAEKNGVILDLLIISQPESLEQALAIAEGLIKTNTVDLVVIDSLAALTPQVIIDKGIDEDTMGVRPKKMGQFFDKTKVFVKRSGTTVIFTNQWRDSLSTYQRSDSPGGWNGKHSFGVRIEVTRNASDLIKNGEEVVAQLGTARMIKNKVAAPYKKATYRIDFDTGISAEHDLQDFAVQFGIIEKSGSWYSYKGDTIAQGENNLVAVLRENEELFDEINSSVREVLALDGGQDVSEEQGDTGGSKDSNNETP